MGCEALAFQNVQVLSELRSGIEVLKKQDCLHEWGARLSQKGKENVQDS